MEFALSSYVCILAIEFFTSDMRYFLVPHRSWIPLTVHPDFNKSHKSGVCKLVNEGHR